MSPVTRRGALSLIPAALASVAAPAAVLAASVEEPHTKVRRLTLELSEALKEAFRGQFTAIVAPSQAQPGLSGFFDTRAFNREWNNGCLAASAAQRIERMTPIEQAKHHAQKAHSALREHWNFAETKLDWIGNYGFVVMLDHSVAT